MRHEQASWWALALALGLVAPCACDENESSTIASTGATTTTTQSASGGGGNTASTGVGASPTGGGGSGGAGGQAAPTEGTITIAASGLSGQDGKRLIASVLTPDHSATVGGICESIDGGAASGLVREIPGLDQCDLGDPVVFEPDSYPVFAGIYPQGSAQPELCASTTATVTGSITVSLGSFSTCQ